jgi:hypothetical protein
MATTVNVMLLLSERTLTDLTLASGRGLSAIDHGRPHEMGESRS